MFMSLSMALSYSVSWWALQWVPEEELVRPARLLLSVASVRWAWYGGVLWCVVVGAVLHMACGYGWDLAHAIVAWLKRPKSPKPPELPADLGSYAVQLAAMLEYALAEKDDFMVKEIRDRGALIGYDIDKMLLNNKPLDGNRGDPKSADKRAKTEHRPKPAEEQPADKKSKPAEEHAYSVQLAVKLCKALADNDLAEAKQMRAEGTLLGVDLDKMMGDLPSQVEAKKARAKQEKYIYRLARASEPVREGRCKPKQDGSTIRQELAAHGEGCRINRGSAAYRGNPDVDGEGYFVHVWTAGQVQAAAASHFAGADDLMLLKYSRAWLLESEVEIRYEEAGAAAVLHDGGEPRPGAYPHVYAGKCRHPHLSYTCLVGHYLLSVDADGQHVLPREAFANDREEDWDDDPGMYR